MTFKLPPSLQNGYLLSFVGHIVILLLLAIIFISPVMPVKWHSFEWETISEPSAEPGSAKGSSSAPVEKTALQSVPASPAPSLESEEPIRSGESIPVLEKPILATPSQNQSDHNAVRVIRTPGQSALRNLGENLPGTDNGFSASLEQGGGEAYVISQPKPAIMPTEEGEVYLEFRLTRDGNVDLSSVNILSYTSAKYAESVQKVLGRWKFGFRNKYDPNRTYRIRCKFVIDE
ncbi:hypothetical protein MASR1M36_13300 [Candidatus Cloacimonadaceae bacterium]